MTDLNSRATTKEMSFVETYSLLRGLKKFGEKGYNSAFSEMEQLHKRNCFAPLSIAELTAQEKRKALESLIFLVEKRDGRIKARTCANGSVQRVWTDKEDVASPTAATESILITATIDAKEQRDVATVDIPNAFIQTSVPMGKGAERIIMKIQGVLVTMLVQMAPELYGPHVVFENGKKTLYVQVLKAIYGMLQSALLFYKKLKKDLEEIGFEFNPYDPCVANMMVRGEQLTVTFHVDDLKASHKNPKVIDDFIQFIDFKYGDKDIGEVKATRGKKHDYLGMTLDYSTNGKVKVDMTKYIKEMVKEFPIKLDKSDTVSTPSNENLFKQDNSKRLDSKRAETFHTFVAKGLFVSKRARLDIQPTIAVICTRVKNANEGDWNKLTRMMKYLNGTQDLVLTLSADNTNVIKWYVDAAFAVHPDFKSHTGATMTMGEGAIQSMSRKQKVNTRNSTEAELIAADDASILMLWTKLFLETQGYEVKNNILYQDNKSAILLEKNGKKSSSKRTRHLNIRYFFLTDQIENKNLAVQYCPTDNMIADYMSKPLQGEKFKAFRQNIMNTTACEPH